MQTSPTDPLISESSRPRLSELASHHAFLIALELATSSLQGTSRRLSVLVLDVRSRAVDPTLCLNATEVDRLMNKAGTLLLLATGRARPVTRIGVSSFAMLLPNRNILQAHVNAYDLYTALTLYFNSHRPVISVCAGVACGPSGLDSSGSDLLELATWRCEQAREAGNVVQSHGNPLAAAASFPWLSALSPDKVQ
jgi:hypothetical protein